MIVGSHQFKIHQSTALKRQDVHCRCAGRLAEVTVVFVDRVGVYFLNTRREIHKHLASDGLRQTSPSFSLYCLSFGSRSKHHNRCNIHLKSESITGQPASQLVVMRKLPGSSRTFVLVLRTKVFAKIIPEHYSQTMCTKTVGILRSGFISGYYSSC